MGCSEQKTDFKLKSIAFERIKGGGITLYSFENLDNSFYNKFALILIIFLYILGL